MKRIMLISLFMVAIVVSSATADYDYWGNKAFRGESSWSVPTNMNLGTWYCQKHEFYKAGTIINITMPVINGGSCNLNFTISSSKTTMTPIYSQMFYNKDLTKTIALSSNFSVTQGQEAYFCAKETAGTCQLDMNGDIDNTTNYTSNWYARWQTDAYDVVNTNYEQGIWYGAFPLNTRVDWSSNGIPEFAEGGGYVYSDGTGNMYPVAGVNRIVSTGQGGEEFYFPNSINVKQLAMLLKRGAGGDSVGIKLGLKQTGGSSDIANCTFNQSMITASTFGDVVYCNVTQTNASITAGNYTIYVECYKNESFTTKCDGISQSIYTPVSRTPDGVVVGEHIAWSSFQEDDAQELTHAYEDVVFLLGYPTAECDDGVDNDGDGFTDYPDDPSCTSASDDSESPFDYVECNNGIDDDGDGYVDYPNDPSCSSGTDTTESPRDASPSAEDDCFVDEGCLLKETFPYNDELNLHGWYGNMSALRIVDTFGNYKLYLDTNSDTTRFNLSKNLSNPNIYSSVRSEADFYIDIGGVGILFDDTNYTFYWEHLDSEQRKVNSLRFDISRVSEASKDFVKVKLLNYNGTEYVPINTTLYPAHDSASRIQFQLTFDQILKTYDLEFIVYGESIKTFRDLPWADVLASKIYTINLKDVNSIDDSKVDVYVDDFSVYTDDIDYDSVCDTWDSPYYLVESFNGYPMACDWTATLNIFFTGQMSLRKETPTYVQQKQFPVKIEDTNTRYVTMKWDAEFDNITSDGSMTLRLYDDEKFNFLTLYWTDGNIDWYFDNDGEGIIAQSNIPTNQTFEYMVIIDLKDDNYDLYFNGSKVFNDGVFTDALLNLHTIEYIKFKSYLSEFSLDNLEIYASTEDGQKLLPDDDLIPVVENETTMCGMVFLSQPRCNTDNDCDSGKCLVNHKCARFDANYCSSKGMIYGNKCFLSGTASCTLTSIKDLIFDNFFLFLVLLVLIMLAVYLSIMFRRS